MEVRIKIRYRARPVAAVLRLTETRPTETRLTEPGPTEPRPSEPRLSKAFVAAGARAAVRAGLIALMFLGTTIGGLEIGHGIWTYTTIDRAAKLGARYAEAHNRDTSGGAARARLTHEIGQLVRSNSGDLRRENLSIVTTWPAERADDPAVRVRVTYPIRFFTGTLVFASERATSVVPAYELAATN